MAKTDSTDSKPGRSPPATRLDLINELIGDVGLESCGIYCTREPSALAARFPPGSHLRYYLRKTDVAAGR